MNQLLVPSREPPKELNRSQQVLNQIFYKHKSTNSSKFYYIGKTETEYSGYAAQGTAIDKEFISYMITDEKIQILGDVSVDTSVNLFDIHSSTNCTLRIYNHRLESLHVNLLPSPFNRLTILSLVVVHFE